VAEQKAMEASGVQVETHNGAFRADAPRRGAERTGHIDGGERPLAEQKAMAPCVRHISAGAYSGRIIPHDVAVGGDPKRSGGGRTGDIDRGECALVEQKTMHTCPVTEGWRSPFKAVQPHDVAVAVDASACRGRRTGDINRGEMALAQEKPVLVT